MCQKCYNELYQQFHTPVNCASCGDTPTVGTRFSRHSPDAETVSLHLTEMTGTPLHIKQDDYICLTCYKLHSSILKSLEARLQEQDSMLETLIEVWSVKVKDKDY